MKVERSEEREMEMLLNEIPHATSPHHHHHQHHHHHRHPRHLHQLHHGGGDGGGGGASTATHGARDPDLGSLGNPIHGDGIEVGASRFHGRRDVDGYVGANGVGGGGGGARHGRWSPQPPTRPMSEGSSAASSQSGAYSPTGGSDLMGRFPDLGPYLGAEEELGFANQLLGMHLGHGIEEPIVLEPVSGSAFGRSPIGLSPFRAHCNGNFVTERPIHVRKNFLNGEETLGANGYNKYPVGRRMDCAPSTSYLPLASDALLQNSYVDLHPNWNLNMVNPTNGNAFFLNGNAGPYFNSRGPELPTVCRNPLDIEAFRCEDSLIFQGTGMRCVEDYDIPKMRKKSQFNQHVNFRGNPAVNGESISNANVRRFPNAPRDYESIEGLKGNIHKLAKHQFGCRLLQQKFDEGKHQVDSIFNGIIHHVVDLMMDQFGNYLMQKLFDFCDEEQRTKIVIELTRNRSDLIKISLNMHGTRAVQKLIAKLKTRQQVSLVISALQPGFLELVKDLNGNHVIQRCLLSFSVEDNKFIFDAAAFHCVGIAKERHGCCVLQRCIDRSTGKQWEKLISEISTNGFELAQDAYGNYAVQYVILMQIPSAVAILASQFEGRYVLLSTQKFSSNVVENCLKHFPENHRATIIHELLSVTRFEELMQDPFANYVIQTALKHSKGPLNAALVEEIRRHEPQLRTHPYCKRIFSRAPLKK
ncbi:putative pumilio homolog 8, chloroplastic isoform X2 [Ananas comosus]|uniref:Pumilio homolog 8, chloroplastic isoform X2 n=1 Tax=Ananas comosus TaxID=4615 RepID=A0A6P5G2P4_ANACO|nr:putative pumilio homolog 8, chloroplastic isoform X2 [Ananas comosus]